MRPRDAFSLIEVLVAISVVLLITAVLFPVLAEAKRSSYRAESIVHLRQVGVAIEMYRHDFDGRLGFRHLDTYVEAGYVKNRGVLVTRSDAFEEGYGHKLSNCHDQRLAMRTETSYEALTSSETFYKYVKSVDPNAAIVADRTHGDVLTAADGTCNKIAFYYSGRMLRLYEDTSVKTASFSITDWKAAPTTGQAWHRIRLFTDAEPPPP